MNTEVSQLYGIVTPSFLYSEETCVFHVSEIEGGAKTKTSIFLAPSFQKDESVVDVNFYKNRYEETMRDGLREYVEISGAE